MRRYILGNPVENTNEYTVSIDTGEVINENFKGIGINSIPVTLMSNNIEKGSNESFFQLEKSRILDLKPAIVRLWTQVDWFVTDKDLVNNTGNDYYNGIYNFESDSMQALYKYLDAYKEAGSEIVIVTNWKVGEKIQSWFSIEGLDTPETSAPKDITSFANAYTAFLKYLIETKGYTNITYVSIANEPELEDFQTNNLSDYQYYLDTSKALSNAIVSANLNVNLLGFDGGTDANKSNLFANSLFFTDPDQFSVYGVHTYEEYSKAKSNLTNFISNKPADKDLWLTEFNGRNEFNLSPSGQMNLAATLGYKSALYWMLNDVYGEDPLNTESKNIGGATGLWNEPYENATVKENYYELALWMRYVKPNSQVLKSTIDNDANIRSTVFQNGDDYTVIVENDTEYAKSITIDFGTNINKTFYKHTYSYGTIKPLAQGTIPSTVATFEVEDTLIDNTVANGIRTVTVYTTIPDVTQVTLEKVIVNPVKIGASYQLSATVNNNSAITWSVVEGNGTVDATGKYTATNTKAGDRIAVKAECQTGEYAIAVIYITE